ncbi:haloacid dehalogenase [Caldibacillus thermoamylovorans]|nr:haloacid dehalogenase [Caldibacillus thermoamylovorans]
MVEYIWFDLGYTLVYLNREEKFQEVLQAHGINRSIEEIKLAYHLADKYFMREHPGLLGKDRKYYAEQYQAKLNSYLGVIGMFDKDIRNIQAKTTVSWRAFPDTIRTLQELKRMGIGVGLISNWNDTARQVLQENNIFPLLDHVVISSELQIEKPDRRIFEHAIELAGISPERSLYIGDNYYDDVVGSRKVGMDSILINPFDWIGIEELASEDVTIISNVKELLPVLEKQLVAFRG